MRYRLAGLSAAAGAFERVVTAAASIIRVRLLIEAVGLSGYGTWLAILGLAQSGQMLNGGTQYALVHRFAAASLDASGGAMRRILSTAFYLYLAIAVTAATVACAIVTMVPVTRWLGPAYAGSEVPQLLAICLVWVFAAIPVNLFGTLLVGTQRQYVLSIWRAGSIALSVVLLFAAVHNGWHSMTRLSLVIVTTDLASSFGLAVYVSRRIGVKPSLRCFDGAEVPRLFTDGFCFLATDAGNWLKLGLPTLLIAGIAGPASLAQFAVVLQLCQMSVGFISLIGMSLWPAYAQSASAGDHRWLAEAFSRASAVSILLAGWCGAMLLVFGDFILRIWLGGRVGWSSSLATLLAIWVVGQIIVLGSATFLAGVTRTKSMAVIVVVEGTACSLGSLILVHWFGVTGVAAAMVISVSLSAVVMMATTRTVVPEMPVQLIARSAIVGVGSLLTIAALKVASGSTGVLLTGGTSVIVGLSLTTLYAGLTWYGVATPQHRQRTRSIVNTAARLIVKRGAMEGLAGLR